MSPVRDVCVIGLGVIGGAVLRAAAAARRPTWGATTSESDDAAARAQGYDAGTDVTAALRRAAEAAALVVLAVPLTVIDETLHLLAEHAPNALLTDVTSVKGPVLRAVQRWAP